MANAPQSDAPFGSQPGRPKWPVVFYGALFAAWVLALVFMAWRYPAR